VKKLIALALALAFVVTTIGCGDTGKGTTGGKSTGAMKDTKK
jgi:hypothetical protein